MLLYLCNVMQHDNLKLDFPSDSVQTYLFYNFNHKLINFYIKLFRMIRDKTLRIQKLYNKDLQEHRKYHVLSSNSQ